MIINLGQHLAKNPTDVVFKDINFDITSQVRPKQKVEFKNCRFYFRKSSNFIAKFVFFTNCKFIGKEELYDYANIANIDFKECVLDDCRLSNTINFITFDNCSLNNFKDSSISSYYFLNNKSYVYNFTIIGECDHLDLSATVFNSDKARGIWDKKVVINATCKKTIFDNSEVNPFYFATKCDDKTSLDLSSARLTDDWSRLRKNYSGLSLLVVLLLSILFFLPIITKSYFLMLASKTEILAMNVQKVTLGEALFFGGNEGFNAFIYFLFTLALIVYNCLRIWMTLSIAKLREEEKFLSDSNFKLVSIHPDKYKNQLRIEKILKVLFWVSIFYSVLKLKDTLLIQIPNI
ncbi:hypothetical protein [Psychroserpens algicola]|uniref:Pentapeptide repeat-containing protein n=1 Tax=Psychroserpens algicola TaxID=1719034 RepID=A0ABT0HDL3_9FLAO|nr:hypothetical protein [Psychroserpens algicola]MCK8482277.1 hypothetical protein [Psychroserpens algicola]